MTIGTLDILQATFSLIFIIVSIVIGLKILWTYFEHKKYQLILLGLFWIGVTVPWWPNAITFLMVMLFNAPVTIKTYFILGFAFLPITVIIGLIGFSSLLSIGKIKRYFIIFVFAGLNLGFEILFFYFVLTDVSFIATFSGIFTVEYSIFSQIYFIFCLIVFLFTGVFFSKDCLRSDDPETKIKGKFLLVAFISFVAGTILDFVLTFTLTYIIARSILVSSSLEFYIGLIFPDWAKRLFFKEK